MMIPPGLHNRKYLKAKRERMAHDLVFSTPEESSAEGQKRVKVV